MASRAESTDISHLSPLAPVSKTSPDNIRPTQDNLSILAFFRETEPIGSISVSILPLYQETDRDIMYLTLILKRSTIWCWLMQLWGRSHDLLSACWRPGKPVCISKAQEPESRWCEFRVGSEGLRTGALTAGKDQLSCSVR